MTMLWRIAIPLLMLALLAGCPRPEPQAAANPSQAQADSQVNIAAKPVALPVTGPEQWLEKYTFPEAGSVSAHG